MTNNKHNPSSHQQTTTTTTTDSFVRSGILCLSRQVLKVCLHLVKFFDPTAQLEIKNICFKIKIDELGRMIQEHLFTRNAV